VDPNKKQEKAKIKLKLPDRTNYQMVPFQAGTNEAYVTHVIAMNQLLEQMEMQENVEKAFEAVKAISNDKLGPLSKNLNMSKVNSEKKDLKKQIKTLKEDLTKAKKEAQGKIVKAYELICVYFTREAQTKWDKIVSEMHTKDPWVAVNGVSHKGPRAKAWVSFLDCIELHKLTIFSCGAAELQCYYMQQVVKKPQRIPVCSFMAPMGLLNDHLANLPMVKDSPMVVEDTKKGNEPFDETDLAGIKLKAVLSTWVNQYNLTHSTLPKSPRQLLPDLENIEHLMNKKRVELAKARAKDSAALAGAKSSPKKRASMGSSKQFPKKACTAKFCQHCKNNGGPHTSHNTKECRKYNKDGKAVAASVKKPYDKKPYKKRGGGDNKQMAYLMDAIESLMKKGLKEAAKKGRKKRSCDDCSSDSDSE
jgi:hypothetical protein